MLQLDDVHAAHSRRRIVVRREDDSSYDKEITTFTPDGRLAQVEYGLEASARGSTVGVLQVDGEFPDEGGNNNNGGAVCICIENSSFGKMHRIDHHLWLVTSGLSGDARMLAGLLRQNCQQHRQAYGEAPTTKQAATMAAEVLHTITRTGGYRPVGIATILVGVSDEGGHSKTRIYLVDPGGGVLECAFCAAGKGSVILNKELQTLAGQLKVDRERSPSLSSAEKMKLSTVAAKMANTVLRQVDGRSKSLPVVDVWTIQPMKNRRGGMLASCYRNVGKDSINDVFAQ